MAVVLASTKTAWYATRATGLVAMVLLTASVVLGVAQVTRWARPNWPRYLTAGLHKNVSLLATVFVAAHVVTTILDGFAPIGWLDTVIPFLSPYRPIWLGLGAVAFDLLLALIVTSLLRERMGYLAWRAVHLSAYACWPTAIVHGLGTGTDARFSWSLLLQLACVAAVLAAVIWRLASGIQVGPRARGLGGIGTAVVLVGVIAFAWLGPLQPGWAARAGTPASLLGHRTVASAGADGGDDPSATGSAAGGGATTTVPPSISLPLSAAVTGTVTQTPASATGDASLTITLRATGADASMQVVLQGRTLASGGLALRAGSGVLGPAAKPDLYQGRVVSLTGARMALVMADATGARIQVTLVLTINRAAGTCTGTITAVTADAGGGGG